MMVAAELEICAEARGGAIQGSGSQAQAEVKARSK